MKIAHYDVMKYYDVKDPAKKNLLSEAMESGDYFAEEKRDGYHYRFFKHPDGTCELLSRNKGVSGDFNDKLDRVPHLEAAFENLPNGTVLEGEVCYGKTSKDVNTVMLCGAAKAIARQEATTLATYYVFDITYLEGVSVMGKSALERINLVKEVLDKYVDSRCVEYAVPVLENISDYLAEILSSGREGIVLKKKGSRYLPGKRKAHDTYKIKQIDTADVLIMDVLMPTSEYTGKDPENYKYRDEEGNPINRLYALGYANSFVIGAYNEDGALVQIGTVASGLDDAIREMAANHPEDFIYTPIEVACMSKDCVGKTLRHPRLVKWRRDKAAKDCTLKDIFG